MSVVVFSCFLFVVEFIQWVTWMFMAERGGGGGVCLSAFVICIQRLKIHCLIIKSCQ